MVHGVSKESDMTENFHLHSTNLLTPCSAVILTKKEKTQRTSYSPICKILIAQQSRNKKIPVPISLLSFVGYIHRNHWLAVKKVKNAGTANPLVEPCITCPLYKQKIN